MFRIILTSTNRLYHPGDTITGRLLVDVNEPKSYNRIIVKLFGSSYVHLTTTHTVRSVRGDLVEDETEYIDDHISTEPYVDLVAPLWNSQQSPDGKLPPGQYNWPFSFNLPPTAPSSFEGSVGNIRYTLVTGNMVTDTKLQYRVEQRIHVQELMKITDDPRWLQPVHQQVCEDEERVRYLCCTSRCDPVSMTVTVPKTGFYLGESFQLHASLENGTRSRCIQMTALLEKTANYHAKRQRECERMTILEKESDWIEPQKSGSWDPSFAIPTTADMHIALTPKVYDIKVCYFLYVDYRWPIRYDKNTVCIRLQPCNCRDEEETAPTVQSEPPQQLAATHSPSPQPLPPPPVPQYPPIAPQSPPPAPHLHLFHLQHTHLPWVHS